MNKTRLLTKARPLKSTGQTRKERAIAQPKFSINSASCREIQRRTHSVSTKAKSSHFENAFDEVGSEV
jgi:hypothetical protein